MLGVCSILSSGASKILSKVTQKNLHQYAGTIVRVSVTNRALPYAGDTVMSSLSICRSSFSRVARPLTRRYCTSQPEINPKPKRRGIWNELKLQLAGSGQSSISKIFVSPKASVERRVLAGLNRFGPLLHVNPFFLWNLSTLYRPYVTLTTLLVAGGFYVSGVLGSTDACMKLAAVPHRYWMDEYYRLFTSPLMHMHWIHLATASGFFLAFGTLLEVACGPIALLTVLLSCSIVGGAAAIAAPSASTNLYTQNTQMGFWPAILGMISFAWTGIRFQKHSYITNNPNLNATEKSLARKLSLTLFQRRLPLIVALALAMAPLPTIDSTTYGALGGIFTGSVLGYLWTRSPHLVLFNGILMASAAAYVAQNPTWSLQFQAFKFASAWENGEFIRAREWLHRFDATSGALSPSSVNNWTLALLALTEMACGRTTVAWECASRVKPEDLVYSDRIARLKARITRDWAKENKQNEEREQSTNLAFGYLSRYTALTDPDNLASVQKLRTLVPNAPWRIMNDRKIGQLYVTTFYHNPPLSPQEMQENILANYETLFNFDPHYGRTVHKEKLEDSLGDVVVVESKDTV